MFLSGTNHRHYCFQTGFLRSGGNGTDSNWFEQNRRVTRKEDVTSVRFDTKNGSVLKSKGWKVQRPKKSEKQTLEE